MTKAVKRCVSVGSPAMLRIRAALAEAEGTLTARDIARLAFVSVDTFNNDYREKLEAAGLIHVAEYRRNHHGPCVPAFLGGRRPDGVPEPSRLAKLSSAEKCRRWRRESGYDEARKASRRLVRPPDFALAALLGLTKKQNAADVSA